MSLPRSPPGHEQSLDSKSTCPTQIRTPETEPCMGLGTKLGWGGLSVDLRKWVGNRLQHPQKGLLRVEKKREMSKL